MPENMTLGKFWDVFHAREYDIIKFWDFFTPKTMTIGKFWDVFHAREFDHRSVWGFFHARE